MTINYNWVIAEMQTKPQDGNLNDVVVSVSWERHITAIYEGKTYTTLLIGNMACQQPSETDFTAYPDLTYEQVCGWLDAGLNVSGIDNSLNSLIETEINPPTIVLPNPWLPN
jgi:hypothetical protein